MHSKSSSHSSAGRSRRGSADPARLERATRSDGSEDAGALASSDDEVSRQGIKLGFLVHDVSRLRRVAYDQLMKPLNFTRARWWVLANLSRHDGMMQSQLADVLEVGKASLGAVVEQLESDGWVERRPDPGDRRAKRVYLSTAAHAFIRKMTLEEDQFNQRILRQLSIADREQMIRMLSAIKESLLQMGPAEDGEPFSD